MISEITDAIDMVVISLQHSLFVHAAHSVEGSGLMPPGRIAITTSSSMKDILLVFHPVQYITIQTLSSPNMIMESLTVFDPKKVFTEVIKLEPTIQ